MNGFSRNGFRKAGSLVAAVCAVLLIAANALSQDRLTGEGSPSSVNPAADGREQASSERPRRNRDLRSLSIEELMKIEVGTVVSASRYRQKISDAPASVTIITAEDIRRFGYRTLADILQSVRGFYTSYDRNHAYAGVRGFGRPGDGNTRILLLVDGHRLNDAVYGAAPIGTDFPLDIDLIEQVEVTRGPGSSLYGSNAFFGVVNIITRSARDVGGTELSADGGSYDTYGARVTYGHAGQGTRSLLLSASGDESRGARLYFHEFDQRNPLADLRATNDGIVDRGDYDRSRSGYLVYEDGMLRLSSLYGERTKGIPTASHGADFNDPGNRTRDERSYLDVQYTRRTARGGEYTIRGYLDHYLRHRSSIYSGVGIDDGASGTWYGGEMRIAPRVLGVHRLVAGVEYEIRARQDQWNKQENPPGAVYLDDRRSSRIGAAYAQDEITVSPALLLYAGLRRDETSTFGGETSPRFSAIITPFDRARIKLLYGRAFRAPNAYELYYEAPPLSRSNPSLKPETIDTYELDYEHNLGSGLRATVSLYSYRIRNLITRTYDAASDTASFRNLERAEATGAELEVRKTWSNGADAGISYSWQKTRDPATDEPLPNAPEHLAKLNAAVPLFGDRLWAGLEEQYTGSRITLAGRRTPGFSVTNLTLRSRSREHIPEISLSIYNLFDKRYEDPVSIDLFPLDTVRQDGRTVRVKVTYAF